MAHLMRLRHMAAGVHSGGCQSHVVDRDFIARAAEVICPTYQAGKTVMGKNTAPIGDDPS